MSAYAGEFDCQQAPKAGFHHHLAKLIDPAELVRIVAHLYERKKYINLTFRAMLLWARTCTISGRSLA
ncbi:MAG: hypothetical protein C4287_13120 [Leptolyngbya sp. ERB_1_2]